MTMLRSLVISLSLCVGASVGCGDDSDGDDGDASGGALTAPTNLKATTVDGKPHLTWMDGKNEEHYMIERMDHSASSAWTVVPKAEALVPNSTQYHDASAVAGKTYMYRVVGMVGQTRAVSNEATWP